MSSEVAELAPVAAAEAPASAGASVAAAVREGLGLAQHVATLLALENRQEASDVVSRFLGPDDLPGILALRDWPEDGGEG